MHAHENEQDALTARTRLAPLLWDELEGFFRNHYQDLVRVVMYLGVHRSDAEDAVQWAIVDLATRVRRDELIYRPFPYVKIAAFRRYLAERARNQRFSDQAAEIHAGDTTRHDDPIEAVEHHDYVMWMIQQLPQRQGATLALAVDGLRPAEIAELLGSSPSTVRVNLMNARRRLQSLRAGPTTSGLGVWDNIIEDRER